MSLSNYYKRRDHFTLREPVVSHFDFPCCCCDNRDRDDQEHPCRVCDHNVNAEPEASITQAAKKSCLAYRTTARCPVCGKVIGYFDHPSPTPEAMAESMMLQPCRQKHASESQQCTRHHKWSRGWETETTGSDTSDISAMIAGDHPIQEDKE